MNAPTKIEAAPETSPATAPETARARCTTPPSARASVR